MNEQPTITPQKQPTPIEPQAKDWNPYADQKQMNRMLVDRLGAIIHYAWQEPVHAMECERSSNKMSME